MIIRELFISELIPICTLIFTFLFKVYITIVVYMGIIERKRYYIE